jgi:hypothetical protein
LETMGDVEGVGATLRHSCTCTQNKYRGKRRVSREEASKRAHGDVLNTLAQNTGVRRKMRG